MGDAWGDSPEQTALIINNVLQAEVALSEILVVTCLQPRERMAESAGGEME